jgi:hypothetical protein
MQDRRGTMGVNGHLMGVKQAPVKVLYILELWLLSFESEILFYLEHLLKVSASLNRGVPIN